MTALCLVFTQIGFLQWLTMVPMLLWLFARCGREPALRLRHLYGAGYLYFLSYYLVIFHWFFYLYPMEFAGVTPVEAAGLVLICWIGLSLLQTTFFALVFPLFGLLLRTRVLKKWPHLTPFLFAVQYTVAEWSQTLTWLGVPWARLPLGQMRCGFLVNSASLFGPYLLTLALVSVNALIAYLILHRDRARFCAIAAAAAFLVNGIAGAVGYLTADPTAGEPIVVAAVQGNVGSSQKWSAESNRKTMEVYEKYTAEAAAKGATLVVFPETFLPYSFTTVQDYVKRLATTYHVTVMCGTFHYGEEGEYNGVYTVYPDGSVDEEVYCKRRLVPFGEFVPWRPVIEFLVPPLANMGMLSEDLAPGEDSAIVHTPFAAVGGLICFDSIYETLTLDSVRDGATLLVLPTNDSWFTDSAAARMHAGQARLRAIESGRWIVRSADTGISAVIDPRGQAHEELPAMVEGVSIATAYVASGRTLYSYIGNALVYLLILLLLALPTSELVFWYKKKRTARSGGSFLTPN